MALRAKQTTRITDRVHVAWKLVVGRLPREALAVLVGLTGSLPEVVFYDEPGAWETARYEDGQVRVNLDKAGRLSRDALVWTLAHELAHAFIGQLGAWAMMHVSEHPATRSELLCALEAVAGHSSHDEAAPFVERTADALALSWGFGREAGISLRGRLRPRSDYLDRELIRFSRAYRPVRSAGKGE